MVWLSRERPSPADNPQSLLRHDPLNQYYYSAKMTKRIVEVVKSVFSALIEPPPEREGPIDEGG
jgi:hypothetical protein